MLKKVIFWFKYECDKVGCNPEVAYFDAIEKVFPGSTKKKNGFKF